MILDQATPPVDLMSMIDVQSTFRKMTDSETLQNLDEETGEFGKFL